MRVQLRHTFADIVSLKNLLAAWQEFARGKKDKEDVQAYSRYLADNLIILHENLTTKRYTHGGYQAFSITDPKPRSIHKASVEDRVLHHAVYRILYPFFDRVFVAVSYSCRNGRGTHKALAKFREYARTASRNNTRTCWVLKCDIRKFFASIDQNVLIGVLSTYIPDQDVSWLLKEIISSFYSTQPGKGLPLGNLTSQLLVNVYMNEFDQYVKRHIKAKHYIRYADDFVFLSPDRGWLEQQIPRVAKFLHDVLALELHPDKVHIRSLAAGVDFLGWINFPDYRVLRTATARRMRKRARESPRPETMQSYLGLMRHGNTKKLVTAVLNEYWLWQWEEPLFLYYPWG